MEIPLLSRKLRHFSNNLSLHSIASQSPCSFHPPFSDPKTVVPTHPSCTISFRFSRFYTNTKSNYVNSLANSVGSSSVCGTTSQSALLSCLFETCNGGGLILNLGLFGPHSYRSFRSFSASSSNSSSDSAPAGIMNATGNSLCGSGGLIVFKPIASPIQASEIIDIIRRNEDDLESKLDSLNVSLSNVLVAQIFRVLNTQKLSAFRFFNWLRIQSYKFHCNSDIYSLLIDNFGRLDDYEGMLPVLTEFRREGIGLNHKAFGFLPVLLSNEASVKLSVKKVVELLNIVGGSFRISGIIGLIQMFCSLGCFGMANFTIEITEKRASFYHVIVREKCRKCDFDGARYTLNEMRQVGCGPDVGIHNYLLSSLCKNNKLDEAYKVFEEMLERDCPPNSLTFEVIIYHLCETSQIESAFGVLEMMVSRGIEPRLSTHAAFVKCYFNSHRYDEAYQYAVDSSSKHTTAQNAIYSLLASLHEKRGDLVVAQSILSEMMDAGLRPNFPVYMRVSKKLQLQGRGDLVNDLKGKFSNVSLQYQIE